MSDFMASVIDGRIRGLRHAASRYGNLDQNFGIKHHFSVEANVVWARAFVVWVVSSISRHIVARKSEVLFVVHYYRTGWTIQIIGEFAAQFLCPLLLILLVFGCFLSLTIILILAIWRPIVVCWRPNFLPRRCWLTPVRLLTNLFSLVFLGDVHKVGRSLLFLSSIGWLVSIRFMVLCTVQRAIPFLARCWTISDFSIYESIFLTLLRRASRSAIVNPILKLFFAIIMRHE